MPLNTHELMDTLCQLSENEHLQVTVKESVKGGIIAGVSAMAGGILLGPAGLAVGAVVGGCSAAYLAKDKFVPLATVIRKMSYKEKESLRLSIERALRDIDVSDVVKLAILLSSDAAIKRLVLHEVVSYFRNEMRLEIID